MTDRELYKTIYPLYMKWVDDVSEACDWKTQFDPQEIVDKICSLINENYTITKKKVKDEKKV